MLTKLNQRFMTWQGFDAYIERTEHTAKLFLAVGLIWMSTVYWIDAFNTIHSVGESLGFILIYGLMLAITAWIGVYLAWVIAVILALCSVPFVWLYRKICP